MCAPTGWEHEAYPDIEPYQPLPIAILERVGLMIQRGGCDEKKMLDDQIRSSVVNKLECSLWGHKLLQQGKLRRSRERRTKGRELRIKLYVSTHAGVQNDAR